MVTLQLVAMAIILAFVSSTNGYSQFMAFMQPDYEGSSYMCTDYHDGCNVSEVISIKKFVGTCGQILDSKSGNYFYILKDNPNTNYYYEGLLSTCPVHRNVMKCPEQTFVKEIEWDTKFNLTRGIKITCYKPESTNKDGANTLHSHPKETFSSSQKRKCGAIKEITIAKNKSMEADTDLLINIDCSAVDGQIFDQTLKCPSMTALSGLTILIESKTSYIKSTNLICSDIPDIAALCKAEDEKRKLVFSSGYSNILRKMPMIKKVGIGLKPSLSDSEKNEHEFYSKFDLEINYSLSNNFKNFGKSEKTGYDWRSAPKNTWQPERSMTVEIEVLPFCETELTEIVGKCSYMEVRPYHLERIDNCNGHSIRTIEHIPHTILQK